MRALQAGPIGVVGLASRDRFLGEMERAGLRFIRPEANCVMVDLGDHSDRALARITSAGIRVSHSFMARSSWIRVTVGLPEEMERLRATLLAWPVGAAPARRERREAR